MSIRRRLLRTDSEIRCIFPQPASGAGHRRDLVCPSRDLPRELRHQVYTQQEVQSDDIIPRRHAQCHGPGKSCVTIATQFSLMSPDTNWVLNHADV